MATSTFQLNVTTFDGNTTSVAASIEYANSSSVKSVQELYAFATGDNTLTKPTGCVELIITDIVGTLKLYGSSNPSLGTAYPVALPVSATAVVVNASAAATATLIWL